MLYKLLSYCNVPQSNRFDLLRRSFVQVKMVIAKKFVYAKPYEGMPTKENLKIVEEELPELKDGEYLAEAVYLSVDPYMRAYASTFKIGDLIIGSQVAKITKSRSSKFPVGKYVIGNFGWRTHTISKEGAPSLIGWDAPALVPFEADVPLSLALGVLGMPGNTAYFGLLELCKPKRGETVVITAAAGGVGSLVGQIAKIKGCTVIGLAGTDAKGKWLKSLGFDHVINYKTQDIKKALSEAAPKGVDCYFDNVGGEISSIIIQQMNDFGRIAVCGSISSYNEAELPRAPMIQRPMISHQLTMTGFLPTRWLDRWNEGIEQNLKWVQEGKLKYKETITEGFENTLDALVGMLRGDNIGKSIVKV